MHEEEFKITDEENYNVKFKIRGEACVVNLELLSHKVTKHDKISLSFEKCETYKKYGKILRVKNKTNLPVDFNFKFLRTKNRKSFITSTTNPPKEEQKFIDKKDVIHMIHRAKSLNEKEPQQINFLRKLKTLTDNMDTVPVDFLNDRDKQLLKNECHILKSIREVHESDV